MCRSPTDPLADFVPPPEPRYVDRKTKLARLPTEAERVEQFRRVLFAKAAHCDWGRFKGDHGYSLGNGRRKVTMTFERGQDFYFTTDD